ncbi:MAG: TetR/AcrR family transcriptional regulator [Desulfomonile tiedjei]|nr:TetR/AcrR family transcriptional regulator [Desulfomonile tiedjei]
MNSSSNLIHSQPSERCEKPPDRRERRRAETRDRIIRAALCLFSERGVATTTVEDITNEADVGKGTFFNYFPSKEHILANLCQLQMGKIRELVSRSIRSKESLDRVLNELALILIEQFSQSPALVRSILTALFSSESARQMMLDDFEKDRLVLAELMSARQKRGEIRDDFAPTELALQFHRALFGTTVLWSLDPSRPLSDCMKDMVSTLWSGIRIQETCGKKH